MTTITLPEHLSETQLLAGIEFTDGTATVEQIGSNTRRFLELSGATISDSDDAPAVTEDADATAPDADADSAPAKRPARKRTAE